MEPSGRPRRLYHGCHYRVRRYLVRPSFSRRRGALYLLCCLLGPTLAAMLYLAILWVSVPLPDRIEAYTMPASSVIVDRQGRLLCTLIDPDRGMHLPVPLDDVPLRLRQAIIATEDATFYDNSGVSVQGILRSLWLNLRSGRIVAGGSTITQQLARNLLIDDAASTRPSIHRKLREAILAIRLSRTRTKDQVLELYLNETYFGNMAYGVEAAARSYLDKPVSALNLAECALLAGLPQAPGLYNPYLDAQAALARRETVLELMSRHGFVSPDQADTAGREPLHVASGAFAAHAPHAALMARESATEILGDMATPHSGLCVTTTLDLHLQGAIEDHVGRHIAELNQPDKNEPEHNVRNAAVVVMDPSTGAILGLVGSPDPNDAAIDGAVNGALALRQPGSSVKPFTYAAAFLRGYSPASMILDIESSFLTQEGFPYRPVNYDLRFHGPVPAREALACSYNVAAVRVLHDIGPDALVSMARDVGISSFGQVGRSDLALTLGGCEVSLVELSAAYAALANGGHRVTPYLVDAIADGEGRVLYRRPREPLTQVLDPRIAYLITDVLSDATARWPTFGAGSPLDLPFPAAVKTGTTTAWRDNWTMGYSSERVVGVWVGNADNQPMCDITGVSGAAPIWHAAMESAHTRSPAPFVRPQGIVEREVCALSGKLPGAACPHRRAEIFVAEDQPTETCALHHLVRLDTRSGLLASADCPPEMTVHRVVTRWPEEAHDWAEAQGLVSPLFDGSGGLAFTGYAPQTATHSGTTVRETEAADRREPLAFSHPAPNSVFALSAQMPTPVQRIEIGAQAWLRLSELTLYVDSERWHHWIEPPYRLLWALEPGQHHLYLEGTTSEGSTVSAGPLVFRVLDGSSPERNLP